MTATPYDDDFFEANVQRSLDSARAVVPIVLKLVPAGSVVDFGCGLGAWLRAFIENGVEHVYGLDGEWVDRSRLLIDQSRFTAVDLGRPVAISGSYDLAVCLEVVEHLPVRSSFEIVRMLTGAAPVVLFSSAIPGQGGDRHINEQCPSYWRELFARAGFRMFDPIRRRIMHDERVAWWYRQNMVMFASPQAVAGNRALQAEPEVVETELEWVHVEMLRRYSSLGCILRQAPGALWRALNRRYLKGEHNHPYGRKEG